MFTNDKIFKMVIWMNVRGEERISIPKIVTTVIHLRDLKGWENIEYFKGNIETSRWFIRRRLSYRDIPVQITKFQDNDYPSGQSLKTKEYEFELVNARLDPINGEFMEVIKHLYFEEIPCSH